MVTTSDLWVVVRRERSELKRLILRESADSAEKKAGVTCGQVEMGGGRGGQENFNKGHKISIPCNKNSRNIFVMQSASPNSWYTKNLCW